jgi:uncharacterized RDD family membrane protein YckC
MTNPYAPPQAAVRDIVDPSAQAVPADRGTRLGAAILDSFIFFVFVYLPVMIAAMTGVAAGDPSMDGIFTTFLGVGGFLGLLGFVVWAWFTVKYMKDDGQSIAKKMMGIKVVRTDGSPASIGRLIWLRNVVNWALSIVPLYGVLELLFIFGESRQCLHDKIADTIVIKA